LIFSPFCGINLTENKNPIIFLLKANNFLNYSEKNFIGWYIFPARIFMKKNYFVRRQIFPDIYPLFFLLQKNLFIDAGYFTVL